MCDATVPKGGTELTSANPKAGEVDLQYRVAKRVQVSITKRNGNLDWFLKAILVKSLSANPREESTYKSIKVELEI